MKAILEFNLPDDQQEHQDALNGYKWRLVVQDIADHLRSSLKHGSHTVEELDVLESIAKRVHETISDYELSLY